MTAGRDSVACVAESRNTIAARYAITAAVEVKVETETDDQVLAYPGFDSPRG